MRLCPPYVQVLDVRSGAGILPALRSNPQGSVRGRDVESSRKAVGFSGSVNKNTNLGINDMGESYNFRTYPIILCSFIFRNIARVTQYGRNPFNKSGQRKNI